MITLDEPIKQVGLNGPIKLVGLSGLNELIPFDKAITLGLQTIIFLPKISTPTPLFRKINKETPINK